MGLLAGRRNTRRRPNQIRASHPGGPPHVAELFCTRPAKCNRRRLIDHQSMAIGIIEVRDEADLIRAASDERHATSLKIGSHSIDVIDEKYDVSGVVVA